MNAGAAIGLAIMIGSEGATLARVEPFWSWNTPICWTGFILFADSIVWSARRDSWIGSSPREFACLAAMSVPLWLVFEWYNRFIDNWYYTGLPENAALRLFGYAWSFATIWPALFEGAELVSIWRGPGAAASPGVPASRQRDRWSMAAGAAMLIWPLVWPSRYLAAPVWLGFIFLLDPINARLGEESLLGPSGWRRAVNLAWSGLGCGLLWEFWNYWSRTKWHYTVPIMEHVKLFEMPLPGFLGFPAFALECFTMYVFARALARRLAAIPGRRLPQGRPIGL
jgi:hypothetical protein